MAEGPIRAATAAAAVAEAARYFHTRLPSGITLAADVLPKRETVALVARVPAGVAQDPPESTGLSALVERTLSKGTRQYAGQALADALDALGVQWGSSSGRQSTLVRVLCLPEFLEPALELLAEMLCRPTFPEAACQVALELARQELKSLEDDPHDLLRTIVQRLTLGPVLGRHPGGEAAALARITPADIVAHWQRHYHASQLQFAAAGPFEPERLAEHIERCFGGLGRGRTPMTAAFAAPAFAPGRAHRQKDLQQQYIAITLPGVPRGHADFATEQVLLGILSGGMSGRLFTEVREKQGLVYWVAAWHEQPRSSGIIYLGASTTPERCDKTYQTLLRELTRLGEDLTDAETARARNQIISHAQTEDDLTRARAAALSDDLYHFDKPIGLGPKLAAVRAVTMRDVERYVRRLPESRCVATLGPREIQ